MDNKFKELTSQIQEFEIYRRDLSLNIDMNIQTIRKKAQEFIHLKKDYDYEY